MCVERGAGVVPGHASSKLLAAGRTWCRQNSGRPDSRAQATPTASRGPTTSASTHARSRSATSRSRTNRTSSDGVKNTRRGPGLAHWFVQVADARRGLALSPRDGSGELVVVAAESSTDDWPAWEAALRRSAASRPAAPPALEAAADLFKPRPARGARAASARSRGIAAAPRPRSLDTMLEPRGRGGSDLWSSPRLRRRGARRLSGAIAPRRHHPGGRSESPGSPRP